MARAPPPAHTIAETLLLPYLGVMPKSMPTWLRNVLVVFGMVLIILIIFAVVLIRGNPAEMTLAEVSGTDPVIADAQMETFPTVNLREPSGWGDGAPVAATGLTVSRFAEGLDHPRNMLTLPNGDVLVAETNAQPRPAETIKDRIRNYFMAKVGAGVPSADRISVLRDADGDGVAEKRSVLADGLTSPFGMVYREGTLYVANTDALVSFPFEPGQTKIEAAPTKLMELPGNGQHWTRNLTISPDGEHLYISVGSATNIGDDGMEKEANRAAIHEFDIATGEHRIFGAGLRNPTGLAFNPDSGELWTTVNERDMLGSDGPPDYLTNVPIGVNYGWPWIYWRFEYDPRVEAPMPIYLQEYTRWPEYSLGAHTAPLGLVFAGEKPLANRFASGAFVARHGSWNRKPAAGYDVVFVRFDSRGNPLDDLPQPVLTGFTADGDARGRPTMLAWDQTGALLVSDDTAGIIWRVTSAK
ncbi:PQQ-dependent sugar dehydrogenase [Croceicoccus naphthovorans]|uniref:PQQ-dependent sugar dehydrogenase n=1 Tax=Croceicoccus naphthovorans TaxID=1348774 RepID=UPI00069E25DC|nr:sorbosone dehydrogenase family protein [Croceicoccus naphthovorans]MBB3989909.1 glucose/arabinose dehydrogenase [Croceicoccus naphthovorans]